MGMTTYMIKMERTNNQVNSEEKDADKKERCYVGGYWVINGWSEVKKARMGPGNFVPLDFVEE